MMNKLGLILNMIGIVILGFQPEVTLWGTGTQAKYGLLNTLGLGIFVFWISTYAYIRVPEKELT